MMSDDTRLDTRFDSLDPRSNSGFALVIALSLMAFVLLLLMSISTLVSVETSSSAHVKERLLAQNNALLGLQVALGELQIAAGPDQRITSNAAILDDVDPTKENYTVVWDSDVDPSAAVDAPIAWLASGADDSETGVDATEDDDDWKELVSARQSDAVEAVRVELVEVENNEGQTEGKMAWWVGDEGVKAKFNLVESTYLRAGTTDSDLRLGASARFGIEALDDFDTTYDYTDDTFVAKLRKTISAEQALIIDGDFEDPLSDHFHDLSFHTYGLLTNTREGGLKEDLTYYFEGGTGGPSDTDPIYSGGTAAMDRITWGQLKSFYNLAYDVNSSDDSITARAQTETQAGVYPVLAVLNFNFGMTMSSDYSGSSTVDTTTDDPSTRNYKVYAHIRPWFVLANPYTTKITVSNYRIRFDTDTAADFRIGYDADSDTSTEPADLVNYSYKDVLENMVFVVPEVTLEPGEALYYSLQSSDDYDYDYSFINTDIGEGVYYATYLDSEINSTSVKQQFVFEPGNYDAQANSIRVGDAGSITGTDIEYLDGTTARIKRMYTMIDDTVDFRLRTFAGDSSTLEDNETLLQDIGQFGSEGKSFDDSSRIGKQGYWKIDGLPEYTFQWPTDRVNVDSKSSTISYLFTPESFATNIELHGAINEYSSSTNDRWDWHDWDGGATDFNIRAPRMSRYNDVSNDEWYGGRMYSKPTAYALAEFWNMTAYTDLNKILYLLDSSGNYIWGAGYSTNYTLVDTAIFFDIPRLDEATGQPAIASLGQLQHFNPGGWTENDLDSSITIDTDLDLNTLGYTPSYAIGNSYAAAMVDRDSTTREDENTTFSDVSYLLNDALFDQYFFSSIPQGSSDIIDYDELPNKRLRPINDSIDDAIVRSSGTSAAENLYVDGAFNVNSTSVDAWHALLNSFRGFDFGDKTAGQGIFPRSLNQSSEYVDGTVDGTEDAAWAGWRHMDDVATVTEDAKLYQLAEAIVEEVQARGPFVSMSDFVNRSLVSMDETDKTEARTSLSGPLQAAIDRTYNTDFDSSYDVDPQGKRMSTIKSKKGVIDYDQLGSGTIYDTDGTTVIANPSAASSSPGWVLQADLLQALEPVLTVRSDTFKIRSYGNVLDPITGEVSSEAYVEAIVQRIPDYVDVNESADTAVDDLSSTSNKLAGRRFNIVDIRFLDQSEI
jgi:Tfp pilus assembly protein PilX/Arc/MetJ-type ribon-helix-helix transcriptional regulator